MSHWDILTAAKLHSVLFNIDHNVSFNFVVDDKKNTTNV